MEMEIEMRKIIVKQTVFLLKIAISVAILYFVFRKVDFLSLATHLASYKASVITVLLLTTAIKLITQYYNWHWCLRINPNYVPKKNEVLRSYFIGLALGFVIPGGYASFGKMFFVENKKKATAVSVGVEKFYQSWIVFLFASFSCFIYFTEVRLLWKILALVGVLAMPFLLPPTLRLFKKESRFPKQLKRITPRIIASQTVYILITFYQYFILLSNQISPIDTSSISLLSTSVVVSFILTATQISITYGGLGIRETVALYFLPKYGIESAVAVAASLSIFFFTAVLPALAGAVLIIIHKKKIAKNGKV